MTQGKIAEAFGTKKAIMLIPPVVYDFPAYHGCAGVSNSTIEAFRLLPRAWGKALSAAMHGEHAGDEREMT